MPSRLIFYLLKIDSHVLMTKYMTNNKEAIRNYKLPQSNAAAALQAIM